MSIDRRRAQRIEVDLEVEFSVTDDAPRSVVQADLADSHIERVVFATLPEGADQFFDARILDLSVNGARLSSRTQPPLLSRLSLSFSFEEFKHVQAKALVMWRTTVPSPEGDYGFGVLFEAIPVDVRVRIHKAITTPKS